MIKRILSTILLLFSLNLFSEEYGDDELHSNTNKINIPRRFLEIGATANVGISNNYFSIDEILVEELILDLKKIALELPSEGLSTCAVADSIFSIDFNSPDGVHIGVSAGLDFYYKGTISKELFEFLGNGNKLNETQKFSGKAISDLFLYTNFTAGYDFNNHHIEFTQSLFAPIIHGETYNMAAEFVNSPNGRIEALASAEAILYSSFDTKPVFENNSDFEQALNTMSNNFGYDITASIERKIFKTLQGAAYTRIPIVPGKLTKSTKVKMQAKFEASSIFDIIMGNEEPESSFDFSNIIYGSSEYYLHRPFKLGAQVVWRPFGSWFTFNHLLGFAVRNPFSDNAEAFVEYNFGMEAILLHMIGFNLSTSYQNQLFMHNIGLILNFRVLEVDINAVFQGSNFEQSLKGSGFGCIIAAKVGF